MTQKKVMGIVRITKKFTFEMAHALPGYGGACRHIHGHSYVLYVTVKGTPEASLTHPNLGMVMDFTELKNIVNLHIVSRLDHALVLRERSPLANTIQAAYDKVVNMPYQPTCENLVLDFVDILHCVLPPSVSLHSVRLHETDTSYAEWEAED
jgi:6-pyruvoyltetrahydropterin/6-carboxytetrahydropterin synthase